MPIPPSEAKILKYIKNERSFNCHIDDKVFIFREAKSYEGGWMYPWIIDMDSTVGKYGKVMALIHNGLGIKIRTDSNEFYYPYTCLRIIR